MYDVSLYSFSVRLAIYYLNAVSKAYQNANMELKRKMQMVSKLSLYITIKYFDINSITCFF